jgi:uncharacterized protein (TIGR02996 family)
MTNIMPTEEEEELLAAIDMSPDDDAPRLAHADWLEANGDPERAAYIRSSLENERDTYYRWLHALPTVHGMEWTCRRGYPEQVRFRSLTAFQKGWPLTAGHRVRHVEFSCLKGGTKLTLEPALSSFTSLSLSVMNPHTILEILRAPHLGPLRNLEVGPYPHDPEFFADLAGLPILAGLRSLRISMFGVEMVPEGSINAFLRSPSLSGLRELRLHGWLSPGAMRSLWRSTSLSGLLVLDLDRGGGWSSDTRPGGLAELGDGGAMPALERFRFGYHLGEGDPGLAVAEATQWTGLRRLDLSQASVRDAGVAALAAAPHLARLERLSLGGCQISDSGAIALAESPYLRSLASLDLSGNLIGRAGAAALGRSTRLPKLRNLSLTRCPAPAALIELVETRFHNALPPVEEAAPAPVPAVVAPSAPLIGEADEDGLLRAIWADPFDEVAPQVYADWLEEQGKPLHAGILRATSGERAALTNRLDTQMQEDAPCAFTPGWARDGLVRVHIPVRSLRSKSFERDGPAWLRRHHVAEVCPQGTPGDWVGLFAANWLAHTRSLSFAGRRFDAVQALESSPHLGGLTSLVFGPYEIRSGGLASLFRQSGLRGLCRLIRSEYYLPPDAVAALCEAPFAPHLRHLALGAVHDDALPLLASAPALGGLITLELALWGDALIKILTDGTGLGSLRNLDLFRARAGEVGVGALAGSPLVSRLRRLRLSVDRGVATTPTLERLARAIPANCRLVLGRIEAKQRQALEAILGERLTVEPTSSS